MNEVNIPYSKNRLLLVDWASLSYHQIFALAARKKHQEGARFGKLDDNIIASAADELHAWNTMMVDKMLQYIKKFNPIDIVLSLEGDDLWRSDFIKEYYEKHTRVFYDKTGYYIKYDNFLKHCTKDSNGGVTFTKLNPIKDADKVPEKEKKLTELPEVIQKLFWEGTLPKYKGNRGKNDWPFEVDRKVWRQHKENFAKKLKPVLRAYVVGHKKAEGDDVLYVGINYLRKNYDSVVLITGDSDMTQIPDITIYNHRKNEIIECDDPATYLEVKVLAGDKADNINGMALPNKSTQLGESKATTLYENESNVYQKAVDEKWDAQYMRNKKLIDLSNIPTHIQREICEEFDKQKDPDFGEGMELYDLDITDKMQNNVNRLKTMGLYIMSPKRQALNNPDMFNTEMFNDKEKFENLNEVDLSTQRKFEDIGSLVDDPLSNTGSKYVEDIGRFTNPSSPEDGKWL